MNGFDVLGSIDETHPQNETRTLVGGRATTVLGGRASAALAKIGAMTSAEKRDALKTGGLLVGIGLGLFGLWKLGSAWAW